MKQDLIKFVNSLPRSVQLLLAGLLLSVNIIIIVTAIIHLEFFALFLLPVYKVILNFSLTPLFNLTGILDYKMPLFIVVKNIKGEYELHNGTIYDMVISTGIRDKAFNIKRMIVYNYIKGLRNIITDIETGKFRRNSKFVGFTHVVDDKSAMKFGFDIKPIPGLRKLMFVMDFLNLSLLLSLAKRSPGIPGIQKLKKIEITGEKLLLKKNLLEQYISLFEKPMLRNQV